jgi:hypothetical protein
MINWINGYKAGNKKEKYSLTFRLGTFTVFEMKLSPYGTSNGTSFRLMIFNLGFEV